MLCFHTINSPHKELCWLVYHIHQSVPTSTQPAGQHRNQESKRKATGWAVCDYFPAWDIFKYERNWFSFSCLFLQECEISICIGPCTLSKNYFSQLYMIFPLHFLCTVEGFITQTDLLIPSELRLEMKPVTVVFIGDVRIPHQPFWKPFHHWIQKFLYKSLLFSLEIFSL